MMTTGRKWKALLSLLLTALFLLQGIVVAADSPQPGGADTEAEMPGSTSSREDEEQPTEPEVTEYSVLDFGANGEDEEDDYPAFRAAAEKAINTEGSIIVRIPAGHYILGASVPVFSNTSIIADENAVMTAVFTDQVPFIYGAHISEETGKQCYGESCTHGGYSQLENVCISGGTWDRNEQMAVTSSSIFIFRHAKNIQISDMTVKHCTDHFINVSGCSDVLIDRVKFYDAVACTGPKDDSFWGGVDDEMRRYYTIEAIHTDFTNKTGENSDRARPFDDTPAVNITVQNCLFSGIYAAVGNHHSAVSEKPGNYTITNNTFVNILSYAFTIRDADTVVFSGNTCEDANALALIYDSTDVQLENCSFSKGSIRDGNEVFLTRNAIFFNNITGGSVENCSVSDSVATGIRVVNSKGIALRGNNVSAPAIFDILVSLTEDVEISGNTVSNETPDTPAIRADDVISPLLISDNTVLNSASDGISVRRSPSAEVDANIIQPVGRRSISMEDSPSSSLTNNRIDSPAEDGFNVRYSDNSYFSNNSVNGAGRDAFLIQYMTGTSLKNNTVQNAARRGISLYEAEGAEVIGNTISGTENIGILAIGSEENTAAGRAVIKKNVVQDAGADGIQVKYGDGSIVNVNVVTNPVRRGIFIYDARDCEVNYNRIDGSGEIPLFFQGEENIPITAYARLNSLLGRDETKVDLRASAYATVYVCENKYLNSRPYSYADTGGIIDTVMPFKDVPAAKKKFYFEPVYWAYYNDITTGTSKTTFSPDNSCTRSQLITFIWRAVGEPEPADPAADAYFADLKPGAFYVKAVNWAYENGITKGISDTEFGINETCTRAMCVTLLYRTAGSPETTFVNTFKDVKEKNYFYDAVRWAAGTGITTGVSQSSFDPNGLVTRGQNVTFLFRYKKLY